MYDMNKSNVKDVLVAIRHTVNSNYAALKSVDTELSGATNTRLSIDKVRKLFKCQCPCNFFSYSEHFRVERQLVW